MLLGSEANNVVKKERGGVGLMCEAYRLTVYVCVCIRERERERDNIG